MRVKKNTIKKMVRKQMMRNYCGDRCNNGPWDTEGVFGGLRVARIRKSYLDPQSSYDWYHDTLLDIGEAFRWLSKVEYDAKFTAAIRNRMPEILRDTADNLAARILEQLPDGYWKP